jgi:DNA-binding transcriptional LysR family regulator
MEPDRSPDPLLGVEFRHLAALAAIARTRSFSRAGEELGYAQSAVSQQVAALEKAIGHQLVERPGGPRPVSLTEAGVTLLRHAEAITARLASARADLDALAAGEAGELRIGTFQSAGARLLPPTLARFRERWPLVDVKLHDDTTGVPLDQLVLSGQLDVAFAELDLVRPPLDGVEILVDPYYLLVPPTSEFAGRDEVHIRELDGIAMIDNDCVGRLNNAYRAARVSPNTVFSTNDNLMEQRLVSTGVACSVMPALAIEEGLAGPQAVVLPLRSDPPLQRHIGVIWHAERCRSQAARAFVDVASEVGREESQRLRRWDSVGSTRKRPTANKSTRR